MLLLFTDAVAAVFVESIHKIRNGGVVVAIATPGAIVVILNEINKTSNGSVVVAVAAADSAAMDIVAVVWNG
mgnify:CR=1 FL=1